MVDVDIISGCELFVVTRVQEMHFYEERNWVWSLFFFLIVGGFFILCEC